MDDIVGISVYPEGCRHVASPHSDSGFKRVRITSLIDMSDEVTPIASHPSMDWSTWRVDVRV